PEDLSTTFGADFTKSPTTKKATTFLHDALKKALQSSPPPVPEGGAFPLVLSDKIPAAIAELNDPNSENRMNFNVVGDIPGNIAGDIGTDQVACKSGNMPSPFNDERSATGFALAVRSGSTITVMPTIGFTVKDTIDLCPGDCGTWLEQFATVTLSQFEATGI